MVPAPLLLCPLPLGASSTRDSQDGASSIQGKGEAGALGLVGQIPWALGREKETGGQEADSAGQPVLQTQSRAWRTTRDHTEEGGTDGRDCTVAAAKAGWGSKLDSMVKPGRMEEQEWGERVLSL